MGRPSHFAAWLLPLALSLGVAPAVAAPAGDAPWTAGDWRPRGSGFEAMATWRGPGGDPYVSIRCDRNAPRLLLRVASPRLAPGLDTMTLVADGVGMDYPVERGDASVTARIALDAPILDRMLVAHVFRIVVGGRRLSTGVPGEPLARVMRMCRRLYWPREARIDPSDAGLAKK